MPRERPPQRGPRALLGLALFCLSVAACDCGEKSEEERLREMVNVTKVHLYVAAKIAVTRSGSEPEVAEARTHIMEMIAAGASLAERANDDDQSETFGESAENAVSAVGDGFALARALFALRAEGKRIVEGELEDELDPVLPVLLADLDAPPPIIARLDNDAEHALFLITFFVLKWHPKSPVPIPNEILLYEASRTDTDALSERGLAPLARAAKAAVLGDSDLCDLAAHESAALASAETEGDVDAYRALLAALGAGDTEIDDEHLRIITALVRGVAHGSTGMCYLNRDDREKALPELERFCDAAEAGGMLPQDVAIVRAYLAWENEDTEATRRYLTQAKESSLLDERDKEDIDELISYLGTAREHDALTRYFDKAFFAAFAIQVFVHNVERSGIIGELEDAPAAKALFDFAVAAGRGVGAAREAVPSLDDAASTGKSWFESLFD